MRIVDLSVPLDEGTLIYPGDPEPRIGSAATIEQDGFNVLSVCIGSQTGTHVDAPYHFRADGARIDELDLGLFHGPALVLDCTGLAPRSEITWYSVREQAARLDGREIVLVRTDWSRHWRTPDYFRHPYLATDACAEFLGLGVRTFLFDLLSPDRTAGDGEPAGDFPVHHLIAEVGGVIGENLCNLDQVDFEPVVSCLPLRLTGADGAPVRAVAIDAGPVTR